MNPIWIRPRPRISPRNGQLLTTSLNQEHGTWVWLRMVTSLGSPLTYPSNCEPILSYTYGVTKHLQTLPSNLLCHFYI